VLKDLELSVQQLFTDEEIVIKTISHFPGLVVIDAPLSLPEAPQEYMRKADRIMQSKGYRVLPPRFKSMEKLSKRALKVVAQLKNNEAKVIEAHPLPTRKALEISTKDCEEIQEILINIGLKGDIQKRPLTPHEIDAATAALTGYLYLTEKAELIGDKREGFIVVPKKQDWRTLTL
jgi:predicted nuclease with RNAse H fold